MPRYIDAEIVECKIDEMQNRLLTNDDLLWDINKPYYAGLAMARGFLNDTWRIMNEIILLLRQRHSLRIRQ